MSIRYPTWTLTNYPDALDKANSNIRTTIIDFEDRTGTTNPALYHVLAGDVLALQQAIFAIEEILGTAPQGTANTVGARITSVEDPTTLDTRYGGPTWHTIAEGSRPTIMGHLHDGSSTGAPKINLASHVTGLLPKANLNLNRAASGLTASDIALNSSTDTTIEQKFVEKLDKTGGTITGAFTVQGNFNSRTRKEADAYQCVASSGAVGNSIADTATYSGTARWAQSTEGAGNLLYFSDKLRYGDYSLSLRMKVSDATKVNSIGKVVVYSNTTLIATEEIYPNRLSSTEYKMFYVPFSHRFTSGVNAPNVNVYVQWYGTSIVPAVACNLYLDDMMIEPLHVSAYDRDHV